MLRNIRSCRHIILRNLTLVWAGRFVKNAYDPALTEKDETLDVSICIWLKGENKAFRIEKHVHNYPHCWRTDKPVLYYPLDSWFIRSTQAREEMMALNNTINWQPESTGTGRFGKWLDNLTDGTALEMDGYNVNCVIEKA